MAFTEDAINALKERRIRPYAVIESKLSTENLLDPWHEINFMNGRMVHDANEFSAELSFRAIDARSFAVDRFRHDDSDTNYLRTGSMVRLKIGVIYEDNGLTITEYRVAFWGFVTSLIPFVDEGFWGVEIVAHDKLIRARDSVAEIHKSAEIQSVTDELLATSDRRIYAGSNQNWISGMVVVYRTLNNVTRQVSESEYQVLANSGGVEFFIEQDAAAQICADYFYFDISNLCVSEIMRLALTYPAEQGGVGLSSADYNIVNTSPSNPESSQRLPVTRFDWDETDGGPIEVFNQFLNTGTTPSNLKLWFDSEENKWCMQFIYQKNPDNPATPYFEPDFEVIRPISMDDPADSEDLYSRVIVVGKLHSPRNLVSNGVVNEYPLPSHPGWTASFQSPPELEGASNTIDNIFDGSSNTQFIWVLGDKVGEYTADGAITDGTENSSVPEFDSEHPYNEISTCYIDLGEIAEPSKVAVHLGSNRHGSDRNPGRPQMLVSVQVAESLSNPSDMNDPNWIPLSDEAFRIFTNANETIELDRQDFLVRRFRYIRVRFHFGLYYKYKPERRFIEYPIREIAVYEDDRIFGIVKVDSGNYPKLYERYQRRGYRTYVHHDDSLQTQDEVESRALEILKELIRIYMDRETTAAWDPRFKLHAPSTVNGKTVYGLTVSEIDPRYGTILSRLITRIEYDLENFIVKFSGTDYFREVE